MPTESTNLKEMSNNMQSKLDQLITDAAAAEATYVADQDNITNIQTAIDTATEPLKPAKEKLVTDGVGYKASLRALAAEALAQADAIPDVAPPPPPPPPVPEAPIS